jgi:magnesium transporter
MLQYLRATKTDPVIQAVETLRVGSWIRSERPTDDEKVILTELGLDGDFLNDALDPHEIPRVEQDDGWTYFITRVPDIGDDFNDFTTPVMVATSPDYIVTVSRDTLGRLWQPFIDRRRLPTGNHVGMFIAMMDMVAGSYQNRVAQINRQMRAATSDVRQLRSRDIGVLAEYERKLNDYLDALLPTNTAVERMLGGRLLKLSDDDRDSVEDLSIELEQVIARCKSLLRTITNLRDSYRAVMDTRLNETIRLLTVITLALTIPTMLAGLFGMNVNIPFDEKSPTTFWSIVAISVISAGSLSLYFLRKR